MQLFLAKNYNPLHQKILNVKAPPIFAESKEISNNGIGLTAVEKIFNKNAVIKNKKTFMQDLILG